VTFDLSAEAIERRLREASDLAGSLRAEDPTPNILPLLPNFLCPLRFRPSLFVQAGERAHLDAFTLLAKAT